MTTMSDIHVEVIGRYKGKPVLRHGKFHFHYSHKPSGCDYHVFEGTPLDGYFLHILCLSDQELAQAREQKEIVIASKLSDWKEVQP